MVRLKSGCKVTHKKIRISRGPKQIQLRFFEKGKMRSEAAASSIDAADIGCQQPPGRRQPAARCRTNVHSAGCVPSIMLHDESRPCNACSYWLWRKCLPAKSAAVRPAARSRPQAEGCILPSRRPLEQALPLGCGLLAPDQSRSDWRAAASAGRRPASLSSACAPQAAPRAT